jgi:hypothetical protein
MLIVMVSSSSQYLPIVKIPRKVVPFWVIFTSRQGKQFADTPCHPAPAGTSAVKDTIMVISFGGKDRTGGPVAGLAEVRAYWEGLRDASNLPRRTQIDPRGMAGALGQVVLLEQVAAGMARIRLGGTTLNDLMGMEVRGMPLSALFDPMARQALERVLAQVFTGRQAATLVLEAERGLARPVLSGRLLLLPVLGDAGRPDLILGHLALSGGIGRTPRRFHIAHVLTEHLSTVAQVRAFAEPTPPFTAQKPVSHLRLVKS